MKKRLALTIVAMSCMLIGCARFDKKKEDIQGDTLVTNQQVSELQVKEDERKEDEQKEDKVSEDVGNIVPETIILPTPKTSYVTETMVERSNLGEGDLSRLAAVLRKAMKGDEITVGVIGGSITQGSAATKNENSYAYLIYRWWVEAFPGTKVNFVNAGIGATNSYYGVHRVEKDLLANNPDIVIVEFSVNDSNTTFYKETYEDLIRKILKQENNPAVILLFNTMEDGTSAGPAHLHVGFKYEIPRISYREAVLPEIEAGTFTWKDISPDNIHPNDKGHAIIGELLWNFLNSVLDRIDTIPEEIIPFGEEPFFREAYRDATVFDNELIEPIKLGSFEKIDSIDRYQNVWSTKTGEESIIFETEAMNIGIMYYKTVGGLSGQYDVYVDGEYKATLNGDFSGGWGNYAETVEIYRSTERRLHNIEIRKSKDSTGSEFSLLGLLIS
jgi:lysophospholipase L1-like esterase